MHMQIRLRRMTALILALLMLSALVIPASAEEETFWYCLSRGQVVGRETREGRTDLYIYDNRADLTVRYTLDRALAGIGDYLGQGYIIGLGPRTWDYQVEIYAGRTACPAEPVSEEVRRAYLGWWLTPAEPAEEPEPQSVRLEDGEEFLYDIEFPDPGYWGNEVALTEEQREKVLRAVVGEQGLCNTYEIYVGELQYIVDYVQYGDMPRTYDNIGEFWLGSACSQRVEQYTLEEITACKTLMDAYHYVMDQGGRLFPHKMGGYWDDDDAAGIDTFEENVNRTCGGYEDHDHAWVTCTNEDLEDEWVRFWYCTDMFISGVHSHSWDAGAEIKPATHLTDGETVYTCTVCGASKTERVEATGAHTWGLCRPCDGEYHRWTCSEDGYTWYALHRYGLPTVVKKVENGEDGVLRYVCRDCGEVKLVSFH